MGTNVTELFVVITVVAVALIFDYTNGFHDSANAMAGPIATGALRPRTAVILAALLNLVGACLATEVAKTISGGFFDEVLITVPIILAGLVGAIIWNLMTWLLGLPSSSSHALFGGLIGAVIVGAGLASVNGWVIVSKVLLPAIVAPLVAGIAAVMATRLAYRITRKTPSTHTNSGYKYGQAFTASLVALAHGTSDGQKTMGVITLALIAANLQPAGTAPQWWVIIAAGIAIGMGTYSGGWRIMRTMGKGSSRSKPRRVLRQALQQPRRSLHRLISGSAFPPRTSALEASSDPASAAQAPRFAGASHAGCSSLGSSPCLGPLWSGALQRCSPIKGSSGSLRCSRCSPSPAW
jgi:PiT family inorganic phosphate transporter